VYETERLHTPEGIVKYSNKSKYYRLSKRKKTFQNGKKALVVKTKEVMDLEI